MSERLGWIIMIVVVGVIISSAVYVGIWENQLPRSEYCKIYVDYYEGNKTAITYNKKCVAYLTNEAGYYLDKYNDPSLGQDSYVLRLEK